MFVDFVFPKDNENEFIVVAKKLKTKAVCFIYDSKTIFRKNNKNNDTKIDVEHVLSLLSKRKQMLINDNPDFHLYYSLIIEELPQQMKFYRSIKNSKIFDFLSYNSYSNIRTFSEKSEVKFFFNAELSQLHDFNYQRNSGLDNVIAKIMHDKQKIYGINFNNLINLSKVNKINNNSRSVILARIEQNIKLCFKYKVKVLIFSGANYPSEMRNYKSLRAFANLFEVSDSFKKSCFSFMLNDNNKI